jgi:hypothetical protein
MGRSWVAPGEIFLQQNEAGRVIKLTPPPAPHPNTLSEKQQKLTDKECGRWSASWGGRGEGGGGSTEVFNKKQSQEKTTFCHEKSPIFGITCYSLFILCFLRVRSSRPATISHSPPPSPAPHPAANWAHFTSELYNTPLKDVFCFLVFSFAIIA